MRIPSKAYMAPLSAIPDRRAKLVSFGCLWMERGLTFDRRWVAAALPCWVMLVGACSPTYNWRDLRPEGAPLQALMPCKPETATRPVPMLGQPTDLHMYSCEAGGLTFAVAWAEVSGASRASEALAQWQTASLAAIRVAPEAATTWVPRVAGADEVHGVHALGSNHQGQAWVTHAAYFSQGSTVYQAAIYGPKMSEQVTTTFFEGLSLQ
jgi:hypothetical protein